MQNKRKQEKLTMRKAIPVALATTAVVAIPVGFTIVGHASSSSGVAAVAAQSTATTTPATKAKPSAKKAKTPAKKAAPAAAHTYVGPSEDMQWGPVQVTIVVKGSVVTDLSATAPTERPRSAFINQQAVPMLRQEVLQAKTAANIKNIYAISGATMTSEAFYQSLLAALTAAHLM
jgi:uncharacterized protein with FMN-binding domain